MCTCACVCLCVFCVSVYYKHSQFVFKKLQLVCVLHKFICLYVSYSTKFQVSDTNSIAQTQICTVLSFYHVMSVYCIMIIICYECTTPV